MGVVAYDGTDFYGWQKQVGGNTVQDLIEERLRAVLKQPVLITGAGRTDSGVHAKYQVFHFDADWPHVPERLRVAVQSRLPASVWVQSLRAVPASFHARYSACGKRYVYRMVQGQANPFEARYWLSLDRRKLELERMLEAAAVLEGRHDFTAFAADRGDGSSEDPVKDLRRLSVQRRGPRWLITAAGSGFLYKMVRALAGALIDVGTGKLSPQQVACCLASRKRTALIVTAPPHGLCLERVYYPKGYDAD